MEARILSYLDKVPPAISGSGGHNQTFRVACILVLEFGLTPDEAMPYMDHYNQRCSPAWTTAQLRHKLVDADKKGGARGRLNGHLSPKGYAKRFPLPDAQTFQL